MQWALGIRSGNRSSEVLKTTRRQMKKEQEACHPTRPSLQAAASVNTRPRSSLRYPTHYNAHDWPRLQDPSQDANDPVAMALSTCDWQIFRQRAYS